jgi:poly(beta-D-mannuronate) lyase
MAILVMPALASAEIIAPFPTRTPSDAAMTSGCAAPPEAVVRLTVISKYGSDGPQRDTIDPEADRAFEKQMKPIRAFSQQVVKMANRYTSHGETADAQCTLSWLDAWARSQALSIMDNPNAEFERAQALAGLSIALLQVEPAVRHDPRFASVVWWMTGLARSTNSFFDATRNRLKGSRNNHSYWAGLASASVAALADDNALLDWAVQTYQRGVCGATAQGALPLELERGKKALEYHLFALNALVPLAAFAEANDVSAYDMCDGALHKIVNFTLKSIRDPTALALAAGREQEHFVTGMPSARDLAFMEIYHRAFPGAAPMERELLKLHPLIATPLGGNQSLLYRQERYFAGSDKLGPK